MTPEEPNYTVESIPIDKIDPLPIWSRVVDETYIGSLAEDIQKNGLINYPTVRTVNGGYQYVTGHCRGLAIRKLGWGTIPCKNYGEIHDEIAFGIHYSENRIRKALNPIEEALTLKKMQERLKCTLTELEAKLKEDPEEKKTAKSTIHDRLMLLELDDGMQKEVASGKLRVSAGVALARCTRKFNKLEEQRRIFDKAYKNHLGVDEVEALVEIVLSDRYAAIPAEIRSRMFDDPFVTAKHISTLFLRPKDGDDARKAACRAMRNEDKVRVVDAVSKKRMSPEKMIEYAEKMLEKRNSKKQAGTEPPSEDVQVIYELEQAVDMVRRKAGEVAALPKAAGELAGRIRQCISLLGRARRQLEKMLPAEGTLREGKEQAEHASAR